MKKIIAKISGVSAYVPDYILTNQELEKYVDTNNEWIISRTGIKERRILKDSNLATSYLGAQAAEEVACLQTVHGHEKQRKNTTGRNPAAAETRHVVPVADANDA